MVLKVTHKEFQAVSIGIFKVQLFQLFLAEKIA